MDRTKIKLLACLFMLADHAGYILFPHVLVLRYIGRLAMPLFAFFIGEGCIYTSNRRKYALSMLILAAGCQIVYIAEDLITAGRLTARSDCWYMNILFTFFFAALGGFLLRDALEKKEGAKSVGKLIAYLLFCAAMTAGMWALRKHGSSLRLDYGICGLLLPMTAAVSKKKTEKLLCFSAMLLVYCFVFAAGTPYVWFSLLAIPLLLLYNGRPGSPKLKYFFYIFYPAHLAVLYLIGELL